MRKDGSPTESQDQTTLFDFFSRLEERVPELRWAFHPANGGWRHKATAANLKRQGVKRGVPDILLPVSSGDYVGFACELKAKGGRVRPEQETWLDYLEEQRWCCVVCWGWEHAAREILVYLGHNPGDFGL